MIEKNENIKKAEVEYLLQQLHLSINRLIEEMDDCPIFIKQQKSSNKEKLKK